MSKNENTGVFLNYTPDQLAETLAMSLEPLIQAQVQRVINLKSENEEAPIGINESIEFLGVSRTTFSGIIKRKEIPFKSLNPNNTKSKKFFLKKDLRAWLLKNREKTIDELKMIGYGA